MLNEFFKATDPRPGVQSAVYALFPKLPNPPLTASYNEGLLSIIDIELGTKILQSWATIVEKKAIAIAVTGFGDVFYSHPKGVSFLEVQRGTTEFIDSEAAWFLSDFLINPDVLEKVLRRSQFDRLVAAHGRLAYSEVFVLEPWLMLGGTEEVANYKKGRVDVYVDLVGQTLIKNK